MTTEGPDAGSPHTQALALFETALGYCGIAWGDRGLTGVQLPEDSAALTRARMRRRFPDALACADDAVPGPVRQAMDDIAALLRGEPHAPADLTNIALDMRGASAFQQQVYALTRVLPPGETTTYGDIARQLGDAGLARAVGQALGHNPFAPVVPCHRVLAAGARSGGFSANGGVQTKLRMLLSEHARFDGPGLFDDAPLS
ncbi:MAG: methylated-DNA--[protein]-cysteine S-methyltransferase [Burkholderiaceae bacterium]